MARLWMTLIMKTKTDMDNKNIYIADSDILPKKMSHQIYSILCICGDDAKVQQMVASFNKAFDNLDIETSENISSWVSNDDNLSCFMDCLTAKNELTDISLSCLVSNHSFAMMVSYIKAITGNLNFSDPDVSRTIESIYPQFEKKCLPLFSKDIDIEVTEEIFHGFKKCLSYNQDSKGRNYLLKSFLPVQMQYNNVKDLCDKLFTDMSMSDYIQYVNILKKLNDCCQPSNIYSSNHSNISLRKSITIKSVVEQSDPIVSDINLIQQFDNVHISLLFSKLIAINDFAWDRLCTESSSGALTDNEKYLIISLWILFMGEYSSWMLSNGDYKRLSSIFEELGNK